jgi:hypothetical protein
MASHHYMQVQPHKVRKGKVTWLGRRREADLPVEAEEQDVIASCDLQKSSFNLHRMILTRNSLADGVTNVKVTPSQVQVTTASSCRNARSTHDSR